MTPRIGLTILPELRWREAEPRWRAAEEMGFDHLWTYDHLTWGGLPDSPWYGTVSTLTAAALVTRHVGIGTFVASPNFRHPAAFVRDVQSLQDVSDGRLLLGLGTGGDLDSRVLGGPELTVRQRVDRFEEFARLTHPVELRRRDRSAVEQPLRRRDLIGGAARGGAAGYRLDVLGLGTLHLDGLLELAFLHSPPAGDQVHQDAQPRNEDHEEHPERLASAAQILAAEDVAEDPEQAHEPGEEQEELEHRQQERSVVVEHQSAFR